MSTFTTYNSNPTADQVYDAMAARVQDYVNRAFKEFPLDEPLSAHNRWTKICQGLCRAGEELEPFVTLTGADRDTIEAEWFKAVDSSDECDRKATSAHVGAVMFAYRTAMDREDGHGKR